ncbi:MAG TPA: hypothetical protein PK431_11655 [Chitinophagales bacterium]|nr:hypothetical protein [Chitinophagales bacterium]
MILSKKPYKITDLNDAIASIKNMYPIDCKFEETNKIGANILIDTIKEYGWEKLPPDLILAYANKCVEVCTIPEVNKKYENKNSQI